MVQGYHEAMELRDRALHQQQCANADAQRLHGLCMCVRACVAVYMFACLYVYNMYTYTSRERER